jgi:hypothetical protein
MNRLGTVSAGRGRATCHIGEISGDLEAILGAPPAPGTLNVVLGRPVEFDPDKAVATPGNRYFWRIEMNGFPCLAYRWGSCPLHIIEVVSDRHLRTELLLSDGAAVVVTLEHARPIPLKRLLAWAALWGFRQRLYYTSDRYVAWTRRRGALRKRSVQSAPSANTLQ